MLVPRLHPSTELVRPAPHHPLDPRRAYRSRQPDPALQTPPHPLSAERLDLPHQRRRATRMNTTLVDRPRPATPSQRTHPTPACPTPTAASAPTTTRRRMNDRGETALCRVARPPKCGNDLDGAEHRHTIKNNRDGRRNSGSGLVVWLGDRLGLRRSTLPQVDRGSDDDGHR
jgi:hypothetical protein